MTDREQTFVEICVADIARKVYGLHYTAVEEVAAAFIAKYGMDPAEAEIQTSFDASHTAWTTRIVRRANE